MGSATLFSLVAGLAGIFGGGITLLFTLSKERMADLLAVGAGFLLGSAFFTLLPGAFHDSPHGPLYVAIGYFGLLAFQHLGNRAQEAMFGPSRASVLAAVAGLMLHSLFDGAALGAAAHVGDRAGLLALLALALHKVPEGFTLATLVLAETRSRLTALAATGLMGAATVLGIVAAMVWAEAAHIEHGALLGVAAGSFLFVGSTDMMPKLAHNGRTIYLVAVGVAMVYLLTGGAAGGHHH